MAEELRGPGQFEIRNFIKNKDKVEFYTSTEKIFTGTINWFDGESFHLTLESGQEITILKQSVVYYALVPEE